MLNSFNFKGNLFALNLPNIANPFYIASQPISSLPSLLSAGLCTNFRGLSKLALSAKPQANQKEWLLNSKVNRYLVLG